MKRYAIIAALVCALALIAQRPKYSSVSSSSGGVGGDPTLGGDLSGTASAATVVKVDGVTVDMHTTAPVLDQILCYVTGNKYTPCTMNTQSIKPGNVKVSSASVLLINDGCSSASPCYVGQSVFTTSATATISAGSGSGTAKVYKCGTTVSTNCPTANVIVVSHPSGGGLTINCVGCTEIQKATPTVPSGAISLYSATFTSGAWTAVTDQRVFVSDGVGTVTTQYVTYKAAVCQGTSASLGFSLPTASPATAGCATGTNTQMGVGQFADGSNLSVQDQLYLPPDWVSTGIKAKWRTVPTTGNVVWQIAIACIGPGQVLDQAFNTASTVTDAALGTTLWTNDAEIETVDTTGCAPEEIMAFKFFRDSAHASDNLAATAELIQLTFVLRRETL